jgi:small-conductance mechanosensitive channel
MIASEVVLREVPKGGGLEAAIAALDRWGFMIGEARVSLWTTLVAIFVIVAALVVGRVVIKVASWLIGKIHGIDTTQKLLAKKIVAIAVWTLTFLLAVDLLGIDLTALAVFSGALGLALGFGLQKTFGNLLAGIILLMDRSIKPGDVIAVNDGITNPVGQVKKIGIRAVSVITRDKKEYLIPNENLMINQVENWSYSSRDVRIKVPISVAHGSDVDLIERLILQASRESERVLNDPAPSVWLDALARDAIEFEVHFWISDPEEGIGNVRSDLLKAILRLFREHHIEVPYPQRDLHLRDTAGLRALISAARGAEDRP